MHRLSIVIPVYNQASYLAETIRSVLTQPPPVPECIVVDDGSTDGSSDVARKFGNQVHVIVQANAGQSVALNRGWKESSGSFVGYLGADDLLDRGMTARLLEIAEAQIGNCVVFPGYRSINDIGTVIRQSHPKPAAIEDMARAFRCDIGPGAIFSRGLLDLVGGWNEQFRQIPDYEFWLRAASVAHFIHFPEVLASWRVHPGSQTRAVSSVAKADEPTLLASMVDNHRQRYLSVIDVKRFSAAGNILSACLHGRSGRFGTSWQRWCAAFETAPGIAIQPSSLWRLTRSVVDGLTLSWRGG